MRWLRLSVIAAVGVASIGAALGLPWVGYGAFTFRLYDIPGWPWYLAPALAQVVAVGGTLLARSRRQWTVPLAVVAALGAAAIVGAAVTMATSRDAGTMFGPVQPAIAPTLGLGGPAAVIAALAWTAAAATLPSPRPVGQDVRPRKARAT
jgi:hypothetical protein